MENFNHIAAKLQAFIRKFYLNKLIKGAILFLATGLLYFIIITSLEYFLWLNRTGRAVLFGFFLVVEISLFITFVLFPIMQLFRISKGISEVEASKIIGNYFPEVRDKLLNLIQLKNNPQQTDLLIASIEQRSNELRPIRFSTAVNFKNSLKYFKYALFPIILILLLFLTGKSNLLKDGYTRMVHYDKEYTAPAPFSFVILNDSLITYQNSDLTLKVGTLGNIIPSTASIQTNNLDFFLKSTKPGEFEYKFRKLDKNLSFQLFSNGIWSKTYKIEVIPVPKLLNFDLVLDYPSYTLRTDETISGTGNAKVPEGTKITWNFTAQHTKTVNILKEDSLVELKSSSDQFQYIETLTEDLKYQISTNNLKVKDFEKLAYQIEVKKDEYPIIEVLQKTDSIDGRTLYFKGRLSDDYGLRKLQLVYNPEDATDSLKVVDLTISKETFGEFLYTFPGNLDLIGGKNYDFYFQVFDNDIVNGSKRSKSKVFSYRELSEDELKNEILKEQNDGLENLNKGLENLRKSETELDAIFKLDKENSELDYNEQKTLEDFIERQKLQTDMMKNFTEKLKKTFKDETESEIGDELKERLDRNEKRLEENEALLEELEKLAEKINEEDLGAKLEELAKKNKAEQRNLEQLLELTRQYYLEEKTKKLAKDLERLAEEQESLSKKQDQNTPKNQEQLSEEFKEFQKEMDTLEEENKKLKKPNDLDREKVDEESIEKDQQDAEENLEQNNKEGAKQKQKDASQKMKEMSAKMQQQSSAQSAEQMDVDIKTLRQILDNLIIFSFEQEDLLSDFKAIDLNSPNYANKLKKQSVLREHFKHIDDSLYSLALRNPMINETIIQGLSNIEFDIEKSLERLSENLVPQGTASQQYIVTGANDLAYLLSQILSGMQRQANPKLGKGKNGEEFQLPDIIQGQEELMKKMEEGIKKKGEKMPGGETQKLGESEQQSEELFEIFKRQQEIRNQLQQLLKKEGLGKGNGNLEKNMERLEEQLLDKAFDPSVLENMKKLRHELLKLDSAKKEQGKDNKRLSTTNKAQFDNKANNQNIKAKEYFNSTEILNRQILPLRQIYKHKVKEYFDGGEN